MSWQTIAVVACVAMALLTMMGAILCASQLVSEHAAELDAKLDRLRLAWPTVIEIEAIPDDPELMRGHSWPVPVVSVNGAVIDGAELVTAAPGLFRVVLPAPEELVLAQATAWVDGAI